MNKNKIISQLEEYFTGNAERFGIETAFLFGSSLKGNLRTDSDIDIGVVFHEKGLSDEYIFSVINEISLDLLQKLNIDIDVVPVYKDFRKPMLYYNIIVQGKPIYIEDCDKYISIKNEAMIQMEDFSLFGKKWQYDISKQRIGELNNAGFRICKR